MGLPIFIMLYLKRQSSRKKKNPEIYLKKAEGKNPKSVLISSCCHNVWGLQFLSLARTFYYPPDCESWMPMQLDASLLTVNRANNADVAQRKAVKIN